MYRFRPCGRFRRMEQGDPPGGARKAGGHAKDEDTQIGGQTIQTHGQWQIPADRGWAATFVVRQVPQAQAETSPRRARVARGLSPHRAGPRDALNIGTNFGEHVHEIHELPRVSSATQAVVETGPRLLWSALAVVSYSPRNGRTLDEHGNRAPPGAET